MLVYSPLVRFYFFSKVGPGDLFFSIFMLDLTLSFFVVHNDVNSYVVSLSGGGNFCNCYSPFPLQIYFFTQETLKLTKVLSLKTFIDADETRVIAKEGITIWVKRLEVPSVMISYDFSFSRTRISSDS